MRSLDADKREALDAPEPQEERRRPPTKRGVAIDGNKIWVSELVGIFMACVLLISLAWVTYIIIRNEHRIHELDDQIAVLKTDKISITHEIGTLREQDRLVRLLKEVIGRRNDTTLVYRLANIVYTNSRQYGYSPELLLAVIAVESRFNPQALGRYRSGALSGAVGLMQIKYPTALDVARTLGIQGLKPRDLLDPEINAIIGTAYLTILISRFRDFRLGILAYNLGQGTVRSSLSRNVQLPTHYYEKVLAQYHRLKRLGAELEVP
jgi:hypothetical protein